MKERALNALYITQFLSAFSDNMSLLVIASLLTKNGFLPESLALVTMAFFLPYILLAPIVGPFADKMPKSVVLIIGNLIKLLGISALIFIDQSNILLLMLSYFTVGVGAVVYSPAKYGILPELIETDQQLFKANSRIEAYTILAILTGIGGGGVIVSATNTVQSSLFCVLLYALSLGVSFLIPRMPGDQSIRYTREALQFFKSVTTLLSHSKTNFSLIGTGAFWMSSAVLRTAVLAWIPIALGFSPEDFSVSLILATTSIGIVIGAFLAPKFVQLQRYYKSIIYGFLMVGLIFIFPWLHSTSITIVFLLAVGCMGGIFIVPMNTVLQEEGTKMVGAGKTIAVQNFVENILMVIGSGLYYLVIEQGVSISMAIVIQGAIMLLILLYLGSKINRHSSPMHVGVKSFK
ncbi:MFS transporter, LPLT family, lysophospholipid transporter [Paenibacillus sp. 1_12]|uniref:lysophospholipid transporter LplT n=1 Tax=Paenibacillus sp. 1_12 TaxID=1566278 RepID=UPI0008E5F02A|nr:lysophospholipid transporter LplT [Paenibacillus sp. 1_12]SFL11902.1 MFS transporter, LPLT family, lysophospholipid transporter [Paenibacillus sp. 1_12]